MLFFEGGGQSLLRKVISGCPWDEFGSAPDGEEEWGSVDGQQEAAVEARISHEKELAWLEIGSSRPFQSHSWIPIERQHQVSGSHDTDYIEYALHRLVILPDVACDLNQELLEIALREEKVAGGIQSSNVGGWHSDRNSLVDGVLKSTRLAEILAIAGSAVEDAEAKRLGHPGGRPHPILADPECWINVSRRSIYNALHNHPGATFSGTRRSRPLLRPTTAPFPCSIPTSPPNFPQAATTCRTAAAVPLPPPPLPPAAATNAAMNAAAAVAAGWSGWRAGSCCFRTRPPRSLRCPRRARPAMASSRLIACAHRRPGPS